MNKLVLIILSFILTIPVFAQTELNYNELIFNKFEKEKNILAPSVSFDGHYLIFVIADNDGYTFYESKDSAGTWSEPKELSGINDSLGAKTYKNSPVYNYDASQIYFEAQNGDNLDIFKSHRTNSKWSAPVPLPAPINSPVDEAEPSISANDNLLFFTRFPDNKNLECGVIYHSYRKKDASWSEPEHFVDPINLGCERSPRILSDNKTLLFASIREDDKKFKIYYTQNIFSDFWLVPKPISTFKNNDYLYPSVNYIAKKIYLSEISNTKKSQIDSANYPQEFSPLKTKLICGKIIDNNGKTLKGTITLLDPISIEKKGIYSNNLDSGKYQIFTPPNSKYILDYTSPGYSHKFVDYIANNSDKIIEDINVSLFDTVQVSLNIFDKEFYEPLDVDISAVNVETGDTLKLWQQKIKKGKYIIKLPIGFNYNIELTSEYTEPYELPLDLSGIVVFESFEKNAEVVSKTVEYSFKVVDNQSSDGVFCEIELTNLNTSKKIKIQAKTNKNGEVTVFVRKGDMYNVTINPQGYAFYSTEFSVNDNEQKKITVELQALKKDTKIEFNNITFETNSSDLNTNSYSELDKIIDLLEKNPDIKVEISAHTDDIGSDSYNLNLSQKRAKSVVNYLVEHDIKSSRLVAKGYGESQPLFANNSELNRAKNRRVELKIIGSN